VAPDGVTVHRADAHPDRHGSGVPTALAVVVDAGRLAAGIVDGTGEVLVRDRVTTPGREVWRSLEQIVGRVLAARPDDVGSPTSVGVACAGPIDLTAGSVSPTLVPAWSGFPLRERLHELTGLPVHLDTLAGAAATAEQWIGEATDEPSFVLLVLDQTIESACVIDGQRLRGAHGNAGALAHVTVEPHGALCVCGASGCLAAYATTTALEAEMNRPMRRATPSIVERTGIMVGRAIASAAAAFDVSTFFLSGAVLDTFGDAFLETVHREVALRSRLDHLAGLRIVELADPDRPLVAAASVAIRAE
jgi:glucokinase